MKGDYVSGGDFFAENFWGLFGDVFVGESVKAVADDSLVGEFARQGQAPALRRKSGVKGGVKASDLDDGGAGFGGFADGVQRGGQVQRGERGEGVQGFQRVGVQEGRGAKGASAMHDAVGDCAKFVLREALVRPLEKSGVPFAVVGAPLGGFAFGLGLAFKFAEGGGGVGEDLSAREKGFGVGEQREFGAGGADVEDGEHLRVRSSFPSGVRDSG